MRHQNTCPPDPVARGHPPFEREGKSRRYLHLKTRPQFLACARGPSSARGAVAIQRLPRADGDPAIRVGFTATKKVGNAVVRNRCKRRLREAARAMLLLYGEPGCDFVFIARMGTAERPWPRLLDDVKSALISLTAGGDPPRPASRRRPPPSR